MIFIRSDEITIRHQAKDGNKLYEYTYNFFIFLFQKVLIKSQWGDSQINKSRDVQYIDGW